MKIMLSAGEVSGDVHGSYLIRELKRLDPNIDFFGMGSEKLLAEGVDIKFDLSKRGPIGIFEALPNLIPIYFTYLKMVELMKKERPDLLLLVDSQGINMPLAKAAKKLGIKTAYYIAPQEWLWGTPRGIKRVVETVGLIVAIFEKEYQTYKQAGGKVVYFGHPLIDIVKPTMSRDEGRRTFLGPETGDRRPATVISLCPGSRTQEIRGLLPVLLKAGELIKKVLSDAEFLVPVSSRKLFQEIFDLVGDFRPKAVFEQTYEVLAASDLAICTSGTINLEASILGVPNIMTYKLSVPTYWIGKCLLRIEQKLPYFSMTNLLLGKKVIPELVMGEANPKRIAEEALSILSDKGRQEKMKASFNALKNLLGSPGVISRCAQSIIQFAKS
jgi:lipid-A-disaccharide synthase